MRKKTNILDLFGLFFLIAGTAAIILLKRSIEGSLIAGTGILLFILSSIKK